MSQFDPQAVEALVRKIVLEALGQEGKTALPKHVDPSGIQSIKLPLIKPEPFDTGKPGDKVLLTDLLTVQESPRLGCGIMEMDKTTFDWTLKYDEVDYVIEGRLEINIDGRKVCAEAGEVVFIPKNSTIQFCVPDYARFLYVVYPADWADQ